MIAHEPLNVGVIQCPCGTTPCRTLPINSGANWFYAAVRYMSNGERMVFRAMHADHKESRGLVALVTLSAGAYLMQGQNT